MATRKKTGRKQVHYIAADGETINGLSRQPDGRWRIIGTSTRFTEANEADAIAKFRRLTGGNSISQQRSWVEHPNPFFDERNVWAWVADLIRTRPQYVAEKTGIEQIAYLETIKPAKPLPTFTELETVWEKHCTASDEQRRKVLHDWRDFVGTMGISTLKEITPELVIAYRDNVYARKTTGKSQANLFTRIRRLVSFARSRAIAIEDLTRIGQYLSLLVPNETTVSLDPKPIERAEWLAMIGAAKNADDKAMLLLMLNCAMYLAEVVRLQWSEIKNGALVTHRNKTGRCIRVATLWPETIEALGNVKRRGDYIFYNYRGEPLGVKGAEQRFDKIRISAKVPNVTSSQLRDGAYTAAVEANVTSDLCKLLVGHHTGIADHYVKRKPSMVAPACQAIRAAYMEAQKETAAA